MAAVRANCRSFHNRELSQLAANAAGFNNQSEMLDGQAAWTAEIPDEQWSVYLNVIHEARRRNVPFALGGAFATASYTGFWRNTKDLDLYVLPRDRDAMVALVGDVGLRDYFDEKPYDRAWIYRAHRGDIIVDTIWAMANGRAKVDERWIFCGPEVMLRGECLRVLPAEEMIWDKLYIMQRDRCDWPALLNLIQVAGPQLDWGQVFSRLGGDAPLLAGALSVFRWLSKDHESRVPKWVLDRLQLPPYTEDIQSREEFRAKFLDSRPWFAG